MENVSTIGKKSVQRINFIIHIFLAFVFLNIMFYFVIASAEEKSLQRTVDKIAIGIMQKENEHEQNIYNDMLGDNAESLKKKYEGKDPLKVKNNNWLLGMMIVTSILILTIPVTIFITLKTIGNFRDVKFKEILLHNLMIVAFVLSFEVSFIFFVGIHYIPVNPKHFNQEIHEEANNNLLEILEE